MALKAAYEVLLAQGLLVIQRACLTGDYVFWPRLADHFGACDLEWVEASGPGTIYVPTVARRRRMTEKVVPVTQEEGPRMKSCAPGVESARIGATALARLEGPGAARCPPTSMAGHFLAPATAFLGWQDTL
ncbi:nucleic acid-binding protein [Sphingomonas sp. CL5.1]|uniref:nucleic acid-binding protein n=1 Tax=Sphingomonas sp. CL5.1 TaxID=2653203 RepID=UPI001583A8B3|nr:nucleic acid-binding protein [Sphingomonas sp. CL5.1]